MDNQEDTQPKHRNSLWMQQDVYQKTQVDGVPVDVNYFKAIINPGMPNQVIINRPQLTYAEILHDIISDMPNKRISTVKIYEKVMDIYPYFKYATARWRNSINSVLSRNAQFRSVTFHDERGLPDRYWTISEPSSECDTKIMLENIISGVGNDISTTTPPSPHRQQQQKQQQQQQIPLPTSPHLSMNVNPHYIHTGVNSINGTNNAPNCNIRLTQLLSPMIPSYAIHNDFIDFCSRALGINFPDICGNEEKLNMAYNQYLIYINGVRNSSTNTSSSRSHAEYIPPSPVIPSNHYVTVDWANHSSSTNTDHHHPSNFSANYTSNRRIQPTTFPVYIPPSAQQCIPCVSNPDQHNHVSVVHRTPTPTTSVTPKSENSNIGSIYGHINHPVSHIDPIDGQYIPPSGNNYIFPANNSGYYFDESQIYNFFSPNNQPFSYGKENTNCIQSYNNFSNSPSTVSKNFTGQNSQTPNIRQQSNFPPLSQISNNNCSNQLNSQIQITDQIKTPIIDNNVDVNDIPNYDQNTSSVDRTNRTVDR